MTWPTISTGPYRMVCAAAATDTEAALSGGGKGGRGSAGCRKGALSRLERKAGGSLSISTHLTLNLLICFLRVYASMWAFTLKLYGHSHPKVTMCSELSRVLALS